MRTVFKILLAPVWLLLAVLKLAFRLTAGAAAFILAIGGGLLPYFAADYSHIPLIDRNGFN